LTRSIEQRLLTARKHRPALDLAMAAFPPNFDMAAFEKAWSSQDAAEVNQANALQGGFENVLNQLLEAAVELTKLEQWDEGHDTTVLLALRRLKEHGVITEQTRRNLADAKELRDGTQHTYPDIAAPDFHDAVNLLTQSDSDFIQDVLHWMTTRPA
jgi:hypothetical protein